MTSEARKYTIKFLANYTQIEIFFNETFAIDIIYKSIISIANVLCLLKNISI